MSEQTKTCGKCGETKCVLSFHKNSATKDRLKHFCKTCENARSSAWRKLATTDQSRIRQQVKEWNERNPGRAKELHKRWRDKNPSKLKQARTKYRNEAFESKSPAYYAQLCRARIYKAFANISGSKNKRTMELIGCTRDDLKQHLEATFIESYGIEPEDWMDVHIDHIVPLCSAQSQTETELLCHFSNLRLIFADENLIKGGKCPKAQRTMPYG